MGFNCDKCDASYPVRKSLVNHKRLKHSDAKLFACTQCIYVTINRSHLEQHSRSLHEKVKEICEVCRKTFTDKSNFNKHVRQFHSEILHVTKAAEKRKAIEPLETQPKRIKTELVCGQCQKEFTEHKNLNKHIKNVHMQKNLKCSKCEYTTNDMSNMQRHSESCEKRMKEQEEKVQNAHRAKEEHSMAYVCNQGPNEDETSD